MSHTHALHPLIVRLFQQRQMGPDDVRAFFSNTLQELPDLTQMHDLAKASARLIDAIDRQEPIGIYGDYDADGTTSCALLFHFFSMLNARPRVFQAGRFDEGYGLHRSSIDNALAEQIRVLVSVDCGISNVAEASYAAERGLDLIITDHHADAGAEMPKAYAVVNPNRRDEDPESPLRHLAGVGVAFALALQIKNDLKARGREMPSIYPLLQFVAIGTIADLAMLTPMNLKLCRHGLLQLPKTTYPGIKAFLSPEERELPAIPGDKVSFTIGPMLNAKGRMDAPERSLSLLIAANSNEAIDHYTHLEIANRDRKYIQGEVLKKAKELVIQSMKTGHDPINVVYSPDFHEGVIGIVASKLVDTFDVPAVVLTDTDDDTLIKGSARTAGTLNLFECLDQCRDLFTKFGGHKAAAGLSMPKANLNAFRDRIRRILSDIPEPLRTVQDHFDLMIEWDDITPSLIHDLDRLGPFGPGNKRPIFRLRDFRLDSFKIMKDVHVKWFFSSKKNPDRKLQGISFNYIGQWNRPTPNDLFRLQESDSLTAQFTLSEDSFNGNRYIQLHVDSIFS